MNDLYKELLSNISQDWLDLLLLYPSDKMRLKHICYQIDTTTTLLPKSKWFEWARLIELRDIKKIIIKQNPDVNAMITNINNTNINNTNINDTIVNNNNGLLIFNIALTTEQNNTDYHIKIWYTYMRRVLFRIQNYHCNINNKLYIITCDTVTHKFGILDDYHIYMTQTDFETNVEIDTAEINMAEINTAEINTAEINTAEINMDVIDVGVDTHIFSDGSCKNNGKKNALGGFSILFTRTRGIYCGIGYYGRLSNKEIEDDRHDLNGKHDHKIHIAPSNIRAEGMAILVILQKLQQSNNWNVAKIHTDSDFWIKMILEYMPKWSSDKFKEQKNFDLSLAIWNEWCKCKANKNKKIHFQFVRAHKNEKKLTDAYDKYCCRFNNMADIWAKKSLELDEGVIEEFKF